MKKQPKYLHFDKNRMANLGYSLHREILITNRRGAYHSTSLSECNTRKQHGLLVVLTPRLGSKSQVLLSTLQETIIQHGAEFNMGVNKYDSENFHPQGHKYIREFTYDKGFKTIYRVGGIVFSKEKMFSRTNNTIFIRYRLLEANSPTTIRFRPSLAFRDINELTFENNNINKVCNKQVNGISMCLYSGFPTLYMQFNTTNMQFIENSYWNKGVEYLKDQEEGLPYKEDLYCPGYFETSFNKGEDIIFAAGDEAIDTKNLENIFESEKNKRINRDSFLNNLQNSAEQFFFKPQKGEAYILSGYPWGKVIARHQFISLDGLTLSLGDTTTFEEVIDTARPAIEALINGIQYDTIIEGLEEPDVLFWILRDLYFYSKIKPIVFKRKYLSLVHRIIRFLIEDRHPRIKLTHNLLLKVDGVHQAASWMDEKIDGRLVTPRTGLLVELNAFWFNTLMYATKIAKEVQDDELHQRATEMSEIVKNSFRNTFLNEAGYLFDYVDYYNADWTVRPNMLYALSTRFGLLERRQAKIALDYVTRELLMSKGLRTKSPKSGNFKPRYEGDLNEKTFASLNGVARTWLIYPYLDAYIKVFQRSGLNFLDRILASIEDEIFNDCIGTISEKYDGSMPSLGHGLISSAIDVSAILKVIQLRDHYLNKLEQ